MIREWIEVAKAMTAEGVFPGRRVSGRHYVNWVYFRFMGAELRLRR